MHPHERFETLEKQLEADYAETRAPEDTILDAPPQTTPEWQSDLGNFLRGYLPIIALGTVMLVAIFPRAVWMVVATWIVIIIRDKLVSQEERKDALIAPNLQKAFDDVLNFSRRRDDRMFQLEKTLESVEIRATSERERFKEEESRLRRQLVKLESEEHINERLRTMLRTTSELAHLNNRDIRMNSEVVTALVGALAEIRRVTRELRDDQHDTRVRLAGAVPAILATPLRLMRPMPPTPASPFSTPFMGGATGGVEELEELEETHDTQVSEHIV